MLSIFKHYAKATATMNQRARSQITEEIRDVGFEVLTAVVMKSSIFWDITPRSPLRVNRHFGGTCRLQFQVRRISHARNQREAGSKQSSAEDGRDMFLRKVDGLQGVISQKTVLFEMQDLSRAICKNILFTELQKQKNVKALKALQCCTVRILQNCI
jgi:hypothetical protein